MDAEEKSEYKRRRVEESRPKSPSTNLPPPKGTYKHTQYMQTLFKSHTLHLQFLNVFVTEFSCTVRVAYLQRMITYVLLGGEVLSTDMV